MKRIAIGVIILIGILVGIFFLKQTPNKPVSTAAPVKIESRQPESPSKESEEAAIRKKYPMDPKQEAKFLLPFAAPITFYGRVIDQYGAPVPDASVKLIANDVPWEDGTKYQRNSDAQGNFSITGIKGLSLYVEVSKKNYYSVDRIQGKPASLGGFSYGKNSGDGIHQPQQDKPVIFLLQKVGVIEPLIARPEKRFEINRDGSPKTLSLHPDNNPLHEVQFSCTANNENTGIGEPYDWRFEVLVIKGGLVESKEMFMFEAPEIGYKNADVVEMKKNATQVKWKDGFEKSYFIKFDDGVYARISIDVYIRDSPLVILKGWLNPKAGSRNLEAGPAK